MPKLKNIAKGIAVGAGALAITSVVATKAIDTLEYRKTLWADAKPVDPENPEVGQRPYPRDLPGHEQSFYEKHIKRPQDFACASVALVGLSPLIAATAVLVRARLGSPVIFKQKRPGKDGRVFEIYKFRSMTDKRDANGNLLPDEDRLTSFGQKLRSYSLDELPELFNILKGDMAVIGPRPLMIQYLPLYSDYQARRHEVRPGLSGKAQVGGRNLLSWDTKFDYDVAYVNSVTFAVDWKLVGETVVKVFRREGISSGTSVTMEPFRGEAVKDAENMSQDGFVSSKELSNREKNLLFLSLVSISSCKESGIYPDLLREFIRNGWNVSVLSPIEKFDKSVPEIVTEEHCKIVRVQTGRIQQTNMVEKGINTILIESRFKSAIEKHFGKTRFDLVLYSTPPITLAGVVEYVKNRDHARTYLLLKDIFPQNSIDIGILSTEGVKGAIYRYFVRQEKRLYELSDAIGCMSQANVDYMLAHNPQVAANKIEVCPNSVEPHDMSVSQEDREALRRKYDIPLDKKVFVYGGNLGKPQGISHLIACLESQEGNDDAFFLIVGGGTECGILKASVNGKGQKNVKFMGRLPKEDYDCMVGSCDVGMIFLDHRFTIPNFPSRLLSYLQSRMPVLAVTDRQTDVGDVITKGGFGWWCESNDVAAFGDCVKQACSEDLSAMGDKAWDCLMNNYTVERAYNTIMSHKQEG